MELLRIHLAGVLNSATRGCELAAQVLRHLNADGLVVISARDVSRVTPSFANAFVMNVMVRHPDAFAAERCRIVDVQFPHVLSAIGESQLRFARGIRLSDQSSAA